MTKKKKATGTYVLQETGVRDIIIADPDTGEDKKFKVAFLEEVKKNA